MTSMDLLCNVLTKGVFADSVVSDSWVLYTWENLKWQEDCHAAQSLLWFAFAPTGDVFEHAEDSATLSPVALLPVLPPLLANRPPSPACLHCRHPPSPSSPRLIILVRPPPPFPLLPMSPLSVPIAPCLCGLRRPRAWSSGGRTLWLILTPTTDPPLLELLPSRCLNTRTSTGTMRE